MKFDLIQTKSVLVYRRATRNFNGVSNETGQVKIKLAIVVYLIRAAAQ